MALVDHFPASLQYLRDILDNGEEWYTFEDFLNDMQQPKTLIALVQESLRASQAAPAPEPAPAPVVRRRCRNGFSCAQKDSGCKYSHPERCRHGPRCVYLAECHFGHTEEELQKKPRAIQKPATKTPVPALPPPSTPVARPKTSNNKFALLHDSDSD
jgi:hypothetical protein